MSLSDKRKEFLAHLWDHASDAFQTQFDERRSLTASENSFLTEVHAAVTEPDDDDALLKLRHELVKLDGGLTLVLQLCGLTRSKILNDLRANAGVRANNTKLPSSYSGLTKPDAWKVAGPYLLTRLRTVFGVLAPEENSLEHAFAALNQATWPGYIRQERAKRSGHEAEYRLATLLASLNIPFDPFEKADNPLCKDAQISGISFDLVVPHRNSPSVVVKSTVHTANIGQFGESKDHLEMQEARHMIESLGGNKPTLLAFIDGVGFRSNADGLNGVLETADEFCQFKTLWKAVVISCQRLNLGFELALPGELIEEFDPFLSRWNAHEQTLLIDQLDDTVGWLEVGDAFIRRTGS